MEYSKIISVTGLPGLYELLSSKGDGAIVRSLEDNSSRFVSSRVHNFSHLESIEIFTVRENVNLADVLKAMQQSGTALPNGKDNNAVKAYFEKVYPDMDFERVYTSDMKKMVKWLEILEKNNIEIKAPEPAAEEESIEEPVQEEAPAKKTKAKATPAKEETIEEAEPPKKKAPAKKKATPEEEAPKKKAAPKKSADTEAPKKKAPAKKKAKE
ncbi:MAG: DUF5606 domain-containing protein [Chitinophagaceae bacterium]|nr:DUF5606 domain-containing protein [Chitinophagaceae bacterium]MCW5926066.1 DUF5606 domain-containing protein [Chitinophagaceae bacterium]